MNFIDQKIKIIEEFPWNSILNKIDFFEQNYDLQYKYIKSFLTKNISHIEKSVEFVVSVALISFQLSALWEVWWKEIIDFVNNNFWLFLRNNLEFWNLFFIQTKTNKRLIDLKKQRLSKFYNNKNRIFSQLDFFYKNMKDFDFELSKIMNQKLYSKTIVFATKIFWYSMRIISWKFLPFPFDVAIPLDSRIKKIYYKIKNKKWTDKVIVDFFFEISKKTWIPPLHLDSILWIKF